MRKETSYLAHPVFLLSLALLLINDFYLKQAWNNALTGKLSDIAGPVAFALFFVSLMPGRRKMVFILTAIGFIAWKSPFMQPFIDGWNSIAAFQVARVPDLSDVLCLAALVPAYHLRPGSDPKRILVFPLASVALFAFTATSRSRGFVNDELYIGKTYSVKAGKTEFLNSVSSNGAVAVIDSTVAGRKDSVTYLRLYNITLPADTAVYATMKLAPAGRRLAVEITSLRLSENFIIHSKPDTYKQFRREYVKDVGQYMRQNGKKK